MEETLKDPWDTTRWELWSTVRTPLEGNPGLPLGQPSVGTLENPWDTPQREPWSTTGTHFEGTLEYPWDTPWGKPWSTPGQWTPLGGNQPCSLKPFLMSRH